MEVLSPAIEGSKDPLIESVIPLLALIQPLLDKIKDDGSLDIFVSLIICLDESESYRILVLLSYAYSSLRRSRS